MTKYYLAHSFASRHQIKEWELEFEKRTGIELLNPFYHVPRPDIEDADAGVTSRRIKPFAQLVNDDLDMIKNSDGIIAIIDENSSIGTPQEMVYAHLWGKPVYTVVTDGRHKHAWLQYHSTKIFTNLNDLEQMLTQQEKSRSQ